MERLGRRGYTTDADGYRIQHPRGTVGPVRTMNRKVRDRWLEYDIANAWAGPRSHQNSAVRDRFKAFQAPALAQPLKVPLS